MAFKDYLRKLLGEEEEELEILERVRAIPYPSRIILDWTPSTIRTAVFTADGGDMGAAADLCSAMRRDARIRGILGTRTVGMMTLPRILEGGGVRARKHLEAVWDLAAPSTELSELLAWGLLLGVGVAQVCWKPLGGTYVPTLQVWDPRWLRQDFSDPNSDPQWFIQTADQEIPIDPGQGWVIFTPYGTYQPWRRGLFNSLAVPWLLKQYALLDRSRHSEVNGSPAWVGTTAGLNEEQRQNFLSDLRSMSRDARIVLPEGCDLNLIEAAGRTSDIYREAIEWADEEMAIAIAGQNVTTEGTKGFAEGDIHERILASYIKESAETFASCLNSQWLSDWCTYEFGDVECPKVRWHTAPKNDLQEVAGSLQALGQGLEILNRALERSGLQVDVTAYLDQFNIRTLPFVAPTEDEIDDPDGV